jgi:hypothetical protein
MRNSCKILVENPGEKRPRGRPRSGWKDNIKIDPKEIWSEGRDLNKLAQDSVQWRNLVNTIMNLRVS